MMQNPSTMRVDPLEETQENMELLPSRYGRPSRWRWQYTLLVAVALLGLVVTGFAAVAARTV